MPKMMTTNRWVNNRCLVILFPYINFFYWLHFFGQSFADSFRTCLRITGFRIRKLVPEGEKLCVKEFVISVKNLFLWLCYLGECMTLSVLY